MDLGKFILLDQLSYIIRTSLHSCWHKNDIKIPSLYFDCPTWLRDNVPPLISSVFKLLALLKDRRRQSVLFFFWELSIMLLSRLFSCFKGALKFLLDVIMLLYS